VRAAYLAVGADVLGLGLLAAATAMLAGIAWALVAAGVALLVLNWRYGPA
jgi:hypothetical protein